MDIFLDIYLKKRNFTRYPIIKTSSKSCKVWPRNTIQTKNGVFPLNGGQILKEFAKQNGINTNHFNNHVRVSGRDYLRRVRRAKKRLTSKVAIPSNRSSKHIKAIVKEKVSIGDFNIGRKIVPTAITTNIIDKTGKKNWRQEQATNSYLKANKPLTPPPHNPM